MITSGNERNRLEPMVDQALHELAAAGVDERPEVVLADAGFFNLGQIDRLRRRGLRPLVSPDASGRSQPGLTRRKPAYHQMRNGWSPSDGRDLYRQRSADHRARLRAHQYRAAHRPLPTPRTTRLPRRMATDHRHPQPPGMKLPGEGSGGAVRARS